jgi:dipeptide/tripeptide permease
MTPPDEIYSAATRIFGAVIAVFGVVIVVVTLANGGGIGAAGLWLGLLFIGLGVGRSYLAWRTR